MPTHSFVLKKFICQYTYIIVSLVWNSHTLSTRCIDILPSVCFLGKKRVIGVMILNLNTRATQLCQNVFSFWQLAVTICLTKQENTFFFKDTSDLQDSRQSKEKTFSNLH